VREPLDERHQLDQSFGALAGRGAGAGQPGAGGAGRRAGGAGDVGFGEVADLACPARFCGDLSRTHVSRLQHDYSPLAA
jgi:hypothetical protein